MIDINFGLWVILSCFQTTPKDSLSQLTALAAYIAPLLDAPRAQELSPSLEQWTLFYQRLAQDLGANQKQAIRHDLVAERGGRLLVMRH